MHVLKKYKAVLLSGLLVVVFCVAAYCAVGRADSADSQYTYAEHIFQDDTVNEINIEIDEADWQDMLENPLEEEYHKANITINGETVGNVAIRTKGNNSLTSVASSDSDRYSFKIDFDYYDDNSNYYGLKKLCLNNNYSDNSSMREYISYKIMGELGLDVPQCGYSNITVNGEEWGLYLAVEAIDETFLETHFDDATGDLYKPEGQDGTGADLVYDGDDISSYTGLNLKTNEDTSDGKEIIALMKALEDGENLEDLLDVESALKYIAANVALANFDSYLGNTTHNYYLYEEDGYFTVIPWDMNLAFGGFGGGYSRQSYGEAAGDQYQQAAMRYIQFGRYQEALNVLNNSQERNARWYYLSALANDALGNQVTALEHIRRAVSMEPDNPEYLNALDVIEHGGAAYRQQAGDFRGFAMGGTPCASLCLCYAAQLLCCRGNGFFCI
mgnify:CR=1 FL=1